MWWETWGSSRGCDGNQGIPLEWKQRESSSSCSRGVGPPLKLHQKLRVLLYLLLETWGFLEDLPQGTEAPLGVQREISVPLDLQHGMQDCTGIVAWKLRFLLELCWDSEFLAANGGGLLSAYLGVTASLAEDVQVAHVLLQ